MKNKYRILINQINKNPLGEKNIIELFVKDYSQLLITLTTIKVAFDNDKFFNEFTVYEIEDNGEESIVLLNHIEISF